MFLTIPLALVAAALPLALAIFFKIVRPSHPWLVAILALGAAVFISSVFLVASEEHQRLGLGLAGIGSLLLGTDLLVFSEAWAGLNQRWSEALVSWHGSYANSRTVILVVGSVSGAWGIAATTYALVGRVV